ncbi:MAG: lipopolysaccharide biosynthesis protein [Candidatus Sericytochromatia bacterium]|nr:lipopolysaccharide biosynthesis protein [Candidatus Sericytochromatia bacterium]
MATPLLQRAFAGLRWTAGAQLGAQAAQWCAFLVLARAVTPAGYGTIASALLVAGGLGALAELGLGPALLQLPELRAGHAAAGLLAAVAVGGGLAGCVWVAAPAIAAFFHQPELGAVLQALTWLAPVAALGVVPRALLERELRFKALSVIDTAAALLSAAVVVGAATRGWGVWAMVAGQLTAAGSTTALAWLAARPRVGTVREAAGAWRELGRVAGPVLGSRLLGFVASHLDTLLVGRLLGPAALGTYALSYKLATWPMLRVSHTVLRVAGPVLMRCRAEPGAFGRGYLRLVHGLAAVVLPMVTGLALLAPVALPGVLGESWAEAATLTQLLCLVGAAKAVVCAVGVVYLGCGRPDLELKANAFGAVKLPVLLFLAAPWGLEGVGWAYVVSAALGAPLQQHLALRLLGVSWRAFGAALARPLVAVLALGLAAAAAQGATVGWETTPRGIALMVAGGAAWTVVWLPSGARAWRRRATGAPTSAPAEVASDVRTSA